MPVSLKPRVAIVDDHTLLAEALGKFLEAQAEIVACYADGRVFLADVGRLRPDIVVLDFAMPSMNGLDVARELRRIAPAVRIIFLTMNEDPAVAAEALRLGASGYLLKRCAGEELPAAVREVMNERVYITPLLTGKLVGTLVSNPRAGKPVDRLSARQREVLQLLAAGRSMKETAAILHVSARTVAFHKYRIMEQLHAGSTAALIQIAVREGLV
jgi:DNA-binding NarL/FixJ family response regulator